MDRRTMFTYHILFSLAVVSVVFGAGLLVITTGRVNGPRVLWPLISIIAGCLFSYFAVVTRMKAKIVFLSLLVACSSLVLFIARVLGISAASYWPLYAIAAGICILPANFIRYGKAKPSVIVISASFILLGTFFSIFSFGFSSMRFKTFISRWWPALFIASGLVLLLVWMIQRLVLKNATIQQVPARDPGGDRGTV